MTKMPIGIVLFLRKNTKVIASQGKCEFNASGLAVQGHTEICFDIGEKSNNRFRFYGIPKKFNCN